MQWTPTPHIVRVIKKWSVQICVFLSLLSISETESELSVTERHVPRSSALPRGEIALPVTYNLHNRGRRQLVLKSLWIAPMIWDNFAIFRTNCAILTISILANPRTCHEFSRGYCHVAWSNSESCRFFTAIARNKKSWVFKVENKALMVGEMVQNSQSLYSFTFNALIDVHDYIYSHSTTEFTFKKYIYSHLPVYFLFTIIFAHIYKMSSSTFNELYPFTFTIEIFDQIFSAYHRCVI